MTYVADRHKARVGASRKRIAEAVEWALGAEAKCENDGDRAAVLRAVLDVAKDHIEVCR